MVIFAGEKMMPFQKQILLFYIGTPKKVFTKVEKRFVVDKHQAMKTMLDKTAYMRLILSCATQGILKICPRSYYDDKVGKTL